MKNKTVFLLYTHPENYGGITNLFNTLTPHLESQPDTSLHYFRVGRIHHSSLHSWLSLRVLDQLVNYLYYIFWVVIKQPDIVHINPPLRKIPVLRYTGYVIITKLFSPSTKILAFFHGWKHEIAQGMPEQNVLSKMAFYIFNRTDAIIVLATEFKDQLIKKGIQKNKIYVFTTCVEVKKFKNFERGNYKNVKTEYTLLFMGRIVKEKGVIELVKAVRHLINDSAFSANYSIQLILAGDSLKDTKNKLKDYIHYYQLSENISLMGHVTGKDKMKLFQKSDIFVLPSYEEGCPVSILEAIAAGLPIITTPVGGVKDIIEENINGIFVRKKNVPELKAAIKSLLSNKNLQRKMSKNNRKKAKQFDAPVVADKINTIYNQLAS